MSSLETTLYNPKIDTKIVNIFMKSKKLPYLLFIISTLYNIGVTRGYNNDIYNLLLVSDKNEKNTKRCSITKFYI